eukprot:scaffold3415_cov368-Prasinococcus_capsulatus_cf.AAC.10
MVSLSRSRLQIAVQLCTTLAGRDTGCKQWLCRVAGATGLAVRTCARKGIGSWFSLRVQLQPVRDLLCGRRRSTSLLRRVPMASPTPPPPDLTLAHLDVLLTWPNDTHCIQLSESAEWKSTIADVETACTNLALVDVLVGGYSFQLAGDEVAFCLVPS